MRSRGYRLECDSIQGVMMMHRLFAAVAICIASVSPAAAAFGEADAGLARIKNLAASPAPPDIGPREVAEMFHLQPRHEECPSDLVLAPDHPALISTAWASLIGPASCDAFRLGLVEIVLSAKPALLIHTLDYFRTAFAAQPEVRHAGRNTEYRWHVEGNRTVLVTSYGAKPGEAVVGVAFVKIQPIPADRTRA